MAMATTIQSFLISTCLLIFRVLVVNFGLFFQSTVAVACQVLFLAVYPFSKKSFRQLMFYLMRSWSGNLVLLIQWFAPTTFVLTFDKSCGSLSDNIQHTENGVCINMPERVVLTSNHQVSNSRRKERPLTCANRPMQTGFIFGAWLTLLKLMDTSRSF